MNADSLAAMLLAHGFRAKAYHGSRVYLDGYGRDVKAWLEPGASGELPADGAFLHVRSSWRSHLNGLRCKGVKHAILTDLYAAGFLSSPPPEDWRRVRLDEPRPAQRFGA
jgi:hypothetical protein